MKDVEFMTAKEKEMVLKQWITFIKNGMKVEHFTDRLYKHLSLHCSFIAHYNRMGFYSTYFERPEDTIRFIGQFDEDQGHKSIEYGSQYWFTDSDYNDLNQAMCEAVEPYKKEIYQTRRNTEMERDIEISKALMRKHGLTHLEV